MTTKMTAQTEWLAYRTWVAIVLACALVDLVGMVL